MIYMTSNLLKPGDVLEVGSKAPEFTLPDQDGKPVALSETFGKWTVFWWYAAAGTPG